MDSMRATLASILAGLEDELWSVVQGQVDALDALIADLKAATDAEGAAIAADFAASADAAAAHKNASMDTLEQKWAYWLRQVYGYSAYGAHSYDGYQEGQGYAEFPYFDYTHENSASVLYDSLGHHNHGGYQGSAAHH